jgi:YVTN family beta-propeller protein
MMAALVIAACSTPASSGAPSGPSSSSVPSASSAAEASAPALPSAVPIEQAGAVSIPGTHDTDWVVLVDGQAWIVGMGDGVGVFDAAGKMTRSIKVEGGCEAMDVGFDAVWAASCEPPGLIRMDVATGEVRRVSFDVQIADSEASVGAGEGGVWLVAGQASDQLFMVDPVTGKIAHQYAIPKGSAGVRAGLGGVWITRPSSNELLHVDPATGGVVGTIDVGPGPRFLAIGEGAVWVMNQGDGTVSRIDPTADLVTATIDVGQPIEGGDIAVGGGSVWVRGGPELLARIDPNTNVVTERYGPDSGSGSVAADDSAVWVTAHDVSQIWRLPLK